MDIDIVTTSQRVFEVTNGNFHSYCIAMVEEVAVLCESPIEALLGATMIVGFNLNTQDFIGLPAAKNSTLSLIPQYKWGGYRIDFCVSHRQSGQEMFFIECDGHDFHERTKDQAARDRKKDRKIQEAGISILRFTGSEIYRDPVECVNQVMTFMNKNVARILR